MGILANLLRPRAGAAENEGYWTTLAGWPGPMTSAGLHVSPDTAMRSSAVWGCVRLISESMATLPLLVYRRQADGGRERADQHPLADLLHNQPNAHQTAFEFIEMMTGHVLLRGNAYAEIIPGRRGLVDQLIPLHPDYVDVELLADGTLRYTLRLDKGQKRVLTDDQVFHIRGLSSDGIKGLSVIDYARESIGLAQATEQYGARFFGNDSRPGGVLQHPGKLSQPSADRLKANWETAHTGSNQHRVAVLEEGMEWKQIGLSPEDSQFLATREFQVIDIARWFRVPLHMIQETSKSTSWGSGIEQLSLAFVQFTLLPWARRWEQAILRDLIIAPQTYYAEFKVDALARGDQQSRYSAYAMGRQWGWLSVNDVRTLENMNPIEGGDEYIVPLNMRDASEPIEVRQPTPGEAPAPEEPEAISPGHYRALLLEAAGRVVRKEIAALSKAWRKADGNADAWRNALADFYGEHCSYVAEVMRMDYDEAYEYATAQCRACENGIEAMVENERVIIEWLAGLAEAHHVGA